jgi:hypothetical protein
MDDYVYWMYYMYLVISFISLIIFIFMCFLLQIVLIFKEKLVRKVQLALKVQLAPYTNQSPTTFVISTFFYPPSSILSTGIINIPNSYVPVTNSILFPTSLSITNTSNSLLTVIYSISETSISSINPKAIS